MKKQFLKGLTMLVSIVALAFVTALVSNAQTRTRQVRANVPFDFVVGDRVLAAGNYTVGTISRNSADAVSVRSSDGRHQTLRLTNAISENAKTKRARLVFHRYGNTYFLTQVWAAGESQGREMSKSKMERSAELELAKNASNNELAQAGGPEIVTIVAEMK
jgi:preprotein translocase subunit YajC